VDTKLQGPLQPPLSVDHLNRIPESDESNNVKTTGYVYDGSSAENHP
jgi:hypothetical protein